MSNQSDRKRKKKFALWAGIFVAFLGGIGVGLQNTLGVFDLLKLGLTLSNAIPLAILTGGLCCAIVNFSLNTDLLHNFWERLTKKPMPILSPTLKIQYWLGVFVFLLTGCLFGLTAFSVAASSGGLLNLDAFAIIGIAAGVFVSLITIPQELETWLASFDHPILTELGKAIEEIEHIEKTANPDVTSIDEKTEILDELYETLSEKIKAHIKQIKRFHARPLLMQTRLTELQTWFAGVSDFEDINQEIQGIIDGPKKKHDTTPGSLQTDLTDSSKSIQASVKNLKTVDVNNTLTKEILDKKLDSLQTNIDEFLKSKTCMNLLGLEGIQAFKKEFEAEIEKKQASHSILTAFKNWLKNLSFGKFMGLILSLANTVSLSLLFTIGLTTFLTYLGVPAFPALIVGFSVAFTAGAYTEFYFYHYFLSDFCDQIGEKWEDLLSKPNSVLGIVIVAVNAGVNGAIAYFGVQLLENLFLAAGIPVPSLVPLAWVSAIFGGIASFLLGSNFWIENAVRFAQWTGSGVEEKNEKQDATGYDNFFRASTELKVNTQGSFEVYSKLNNPVPIEKNNLDKSAMSILTVT